MQRELNPERLAEELAVLLDPETNASMRRTLGEVTEKLGTGGASERAAQFILKFLQ
jgi:lipid A disaccharide synthetase